MSDLARWSLTVSRDTDLALRTLLASRGGRKGDLSKFVEEAVSREVVRETVRDIQAQNADLDETAIEELLEEELPAARKEFWSNRR